MANKEQPWPSSQWRVQKLWGKWRRQGCDRVGGGGEGQVRDGWGVGGQVGDGGREVWAGRGEGGEKAGLEERPVRRRAEGGEVSSALWGLIYTHKTHLPEFP